MRRAVLRWPAMPAARGVLRAREGAVADLQLDDVLAGRLEPLGDGQHVEGGFGGQAAGEVTQGGGHGGRQ